MQMKKKVFLFLIFLVYKRILFGWIVVRVPEWFCTLSVINMKFTRENKCRLPSPINNVLWYTRVGTPIYERFRQPQPDRIEYRSLAIYNRLREVDLSTRLYVTQYIIIVYYNIIKTLLNQSSVFRQFVQQ